MSEKNAWDLEQDEKLSRLNKRNDEIEKNHLVETVRRVEKEKSLDKDIKFVREALSRHKVDDKKHKKDREEIEDRRFLKLENKATYNAILLTIITSSIVIVGGYAVIFFLDTTFKNMQTLEPIAIQENNNSKGNTWR